MKYGVLSGARLAVARGVLWTAWTACWLMMRVLLRPDHPLRTYYDGARKSTMPVLLDSLYHTQGRRYKRGRWYAATLIATAGVTAEMSFGVTGLLMSF